MIFMEYYTQLYFSRFTATDSEIEDFLHSIQMPSLCIDARNELDTEITLEEIISALNYFPNGKAPGPDSFGI